MKKIVGMLLVCLALISGTSHAKGASGIITFKVNLNASKETRLARLWMPYPLSDSYQRIEDIRINGNFSNSAIYREAANGALYLFAEWHGPQNNRSLELKFWAHAKERVVGDLKATNLSIPVEIEKYLQSNPWIPTDGAVGKMAASIMDSKRGLLEKARAVYDWVVDNTTRDPNVRGCGLGIVEVTLAKRSGKCTDLSSVFIALARASGVPAREVFGLRLGKKAEQNITGGYHCWAEFYLPGKGWVPVDPSDVRKKMLADKLELKQAEPYRHYYFGTVDAHRIVLGRGGRGLLLYPPQEAGLLNNLMYPYAEVDGKPLDYFDPKGFSYSVHFKAL